MPSDDLTQSFILNLQQVGAEVRDLRRELQKATPEIIGWANFKEYQKEVADEFRRVDNSLEEVREVCEDYKTEKKHLVDSATLVEAKHEVIDLGLSKIDFDKFIVDDASYKKEIRDELKSYREQSFAFNWSWGCIKQVFNLRWVQALVVGVGTLLIGSFSNTTARSIFNEGWIPEHGVLQVAIGIFVCVWLIIFIAFKKS